MNILIFGATGMLGQALCRRLSKTHTITVAGRDLKKLTNCFGSNVKQITNDQFSSQAAETLREFDIVINLAGENIGARRWSSQQKQRILSSRVTITHQIATACAQLGPRLSPRLYNASAIGIYGLQPTIEQQNQITYTEHSPPPEHPSDFLSSVAKAWEAAANPAIQAGIPVTFMRFAVILSKSGGALGKLLPPFQLGLGGPIGSGNQPFSWVSINDVVRAIEFLIDHSEVSGPVNIVAPDIVSQAQFASTLGKVLHRPALLPLPAILVKILFGQMGTEALLNGHRVESTILGEAGFEFEHKTLSNGLQSALDDMS